MSVSGVQEEEVVVPVVELPPVWEVVVEDAPKVRSTWVQAARATTAAARVQEVKARRASCAGILE
jgi:hypothetical protein